jgi:hypothetical protein
VNWPFERSLIDSEGIDSLGWIDSERTTSVVWIDSKRVGHGGHRRESVTKMKITPFQNHEIESKENSLKIGETLRLSMKLDRGQEDAFQTHTKLPISNM